MWMWGWGSSSAAVVALGVLSALARDRGLVPALARSPCPSAYQAGAKPELNVVEGGLYERRNPGGAGDKCKTASISEFFSAELLLLEGRFGNDHSKGNSGLFWFFFL